MFCDVLRVNAVVLNRRSTMGFVCRFLTMDLVNTAKNQLASIDEGKKSLNYKIADVFRSVGGLFGYFRYDYIKN